MKIKTMKSIMMFVLVWTLIIPGSVNAQTNEIKLWQSFAPGTEKKVNTEKWDNNKKQLTGVYQPRLIAFLPKNKDARVFKITAPDTLIDARRLGG